MKAYHDILNLVLNNGVRQANRTGVDTLTVPGAMFQHHLKDGFPAVTTKKLYFNAVVAELLGFIRGYTSAKDFRDLGCNIWNANANENQAWLSNPKREGHDDLGRVYGAQWRDWRSVRVFDYAADSVTCASTDQLDLAIKTIVKDPTNRRIVVSAWRPDELDQMALPPCHLLFQFLVNVERQELNLCWCQRSVDSFLGLPFNIASYALLTHLVAGITGLKPGVLTGFLADTHIYVNHLDQVREQLSREPLPLPGLVCVLPDQPTEAAGASLLEAIRPQDVWLLDYAHHPAIKAGMAV